MDPAYVVMNSIDHQYPEAKGIQTEHTDRLMFPVDHYHWNTAMAIICAHDGEVELASDYAKRALQATKEEHSGFRYHPKIGLVKKQDKAIQKQLSKLSKA